MLGHRIETSLALLLLLLAGLMPAAAPPRPGLDELLVEYRLQGLPLPPRNARLVRYQATSEYLLNDKVVPPSDSLAFLVREGKKVWLLHGTQTLPLPEPPPPIEKPATAASARERGVAGLHDPLFAIQCYSLGWKELAVELLRQARQAGATVSRQKLRTTAWIYWEGRISEPDSDWRLVLRHLKALLAQEGKEAPEYHHHLVRSLELALVPGKAKPGSIEALIDRLVQEPATTGTIGAFTRGEAYTDVASQGFKAVPALIEALDDERMTRRVMQGFNNFPTWHMRVQHVASDLLEDIAGKNLERDWLRRQQGYPVKKAAARAWWNEARKVGEEAYVLARVLPRDGVSVNTFYVELIAARYPRHLPQLYRTLLDKHPKMQGWHLAAAVAKSKLPHKEKVELFRYAVSRPSLMHRREALFQLKDLDRGLFARTVNKTLKELPARPKNAYWKCEEAFFSAFVPLTGDEKSWELLDKVAHRSSLGLRMELLANLARFNEGEARSPIIRRRQLAFWARFLDDSTVRDLASDKKRFDGPCAGFCYPRLTVRDLVAMEMAALLKIEVRLKPERTPAEWETLRKQVRTAWEREQKTRPGKPR
jgi:hypothetical protein